MSDLPALGWSADLATAFAPYALTHRCARVTRVDRSAVDALVAGDDFTGIRATPRSHDISPVVGDWVVVIEDGGEWRIDALLPRRTTIERAAVSGRSESQVMAANVDLVLIAMPVVPEPKLTLVERMVALAWDSGATPVVVVTKADLSADSDAIVADLAEAAPGVDVVAVSVVAEDGLAALAPYLVDGRTLCVLGRSGAGKSSLVNALVGAEVLETAEIRRDGKGRHTTTHREMSVLPSGAVIVDTPGLRGAGLWVTEEGLDRTFADIEELVIGCRFTDCAHVQEPGCAVLAAVEDGRLPQRRLDSWHKLQREARWMAMRSDARLRAEARRARVVTHKEVRRSGRIRP
ncbi:MAG TPA: ribosome small subunit-dependent GTPase A [Mycobacteriales bacterium]|nr:ribosome small subunit-dependent GTPase A [Mycobacteriales bacterium]